MIYFFFLTNPWKNSQIPKQRIALLLRIDTASRFLSTNKWNRDGKNSHKITLLIDRIIDVSSFTNSSILQQTTICPNFFLAVLHELFFTIATCFCLRLWPIYQYKTVKTETMRALSGSTLRDQNSMN